MKKTFFGQKFLGVISEATPEITRFISLDSLREDKNYYHRLILNLKKINQHVIYRHLKVEKV